MSVDAEQQFDGLLEYLKRARGFDFGAYKRGGLMRRVQRRLQVVQIESFADYVDYLEVHPDEFTRLFNAILINVTAFFRDPPVWEYVAAEVLPKIVAAKGPAEPIRVWSAGCASGEEAYTLAMLLAQQVGVEQFRERVKIYASNVDEESLNKARSASYTAQEVEPIPRELLAAYFELAGDRYLFHKELRRAVIFGRHDLVQDAPISRIDLLVCRNTLMYFNAETQARILARFHFALNNGGFLLLGKAEMLLTHSSIFTPVDLKKRVFSRVPKNNIRDRLLMMAQAGREDAANHLANHVRIREAAFDVDPVAQLVIDFSGALVLANDSARALFRLTAGDVGRPVGELEFSHSPIELQPHLDLVGMERRTLYLPRVDCTLAGERRSMDVQIMPLVDSGDGLLGTKVLYIDVSRLKSVHDENSDLKQELETTREELQTTNEELQSTIEELETTNEELQSTNEELETMNEELQSTNEELRTMNDELVRRGEELNDVNAFLESILGSLQAGVTVLNANLQVQIWNHRAEDLWGLRSEEVTGKNFLNLDIGLPVDRLKQSIRSCLTGGDRHQLSLEATNRRGKAIQCGVTCTPLMGAGEQVQGVIVLMEELDST